MSRNLETLAVAAHSGSVVLHSLAVVYHCQTAKRFDGWAAMHAAIVSISAVSIVVHARRISQETSQKQGLELASD